VTDRLDGRFGSLRAVAILAAAMVAACQPHDPFQAVPVPPDGGTPCTRDVAVDSDTVVISAGICNPWCIHVTAGTSVYFINNDPILYYLVADPPLPYDLQVPGYAGTVTLPLTAPGAVTWTEVHHPAATATIFVE
jgi:hypothetical protein